MNNFPIEPWLMVLIIIVAIIEIILKAIALWRAGRNNHLAWFICLIIFNTAGILPIVYLSLQRKKNKL